MKIVVSHPTGNQSSRALIKTLAKSNLLAEFNTTVAADPDAFWINLLPDGIRREWLRRVFPIDSNFIWTHPMRELARLSLPRLGFNWPIRHETGWASIDSVYQNFDAAVAQRLVRSAIPKKVDAVYASEDGALATFKQAKTLGLKCIYDLPITYWKISRKLLHEEAERLPAWAVTLGGGINDSAAKLERKVQELELADVVVCPGEFVRDSLPASVAGKPVIIAPFGSPFVKESESKYKTNWQSGRPLRVLFAGSMSQRKGLGDLFTAIKLLDRRDIELVVVGSLQAPIKFYRSELPAFTYEPGRPHDQVLALMRSCDVFCLPSIVEGRALVMQEAMSQGLPLIITPNTGGTDLIKEGSTGFLVPIRSPEAIAEKLTWFLENRPLIPDMSKMARRHAAEYTWENYAAHIVKSITDLWNKPSHNLHTSIS